MGADFFLIPAICYKDESNYILKNSTPRKNCARYGSNESKKGVG